MATISGLNPSTTYYIDVVLLDENGDRVSSSSSDLTVRTLATAPPPSPPPDPPSPPPTPSSSIPTPVASSLATFRAAGLTVQGDYSGDTPPNPQLYAEFQLDDNSSFTHPTTVYDNTFTKTAGPNTIWTQSAASGPDLGTVYIRGRLRTASNGRGSFGQWSNTVSVTVFSTPEIYEATGARIHCFVLNDVTALNWSATMRIVGPVGDSAASVLRYDNAGTYNRDDRATEWDFVEPITPGLYYIRARLTSAPNGGGAQSHPSPTRRVRVGSPPAGATDRLGGSLGVPTVVDRTQTTIQLSVQYSGTDATDIVGYVWHIGFDFDDPIFMSSGPTMTFTGLTPGAEYTIQVTAVNDVDTETSSITTSTLPGSLAAPTETDRTSSTLGLAIDPVEGATSYRWRYSNTGAITDSSPSVTTTDPTVTIADLLTGRQYWIDVEVTTPTGTFVSLELLTSTLIAAPASRRTLSNRIDLLIPNPFFPIATFTWRYSTDSTITDADPSVVTSGRTAAIIGLTPDTEYWVQVTAATSSGIMFESEVFMFRTLEE